MIAVGFCFDGRGRNGIRRGRRYGVHVDDPVAGRRRRYPIVGFRRLDSGIYLSGRADFGTLLPRLGPSVFEPDLKIKSKNH